MTAQIPSLKAPRLFLVLINCNAVSRSAAVSRGYLPAGANRRSS